MFSEKKCESGDYKKWSMPEDAPSNGKSKHTPYFYMPYNMVRQNTHPTFTCSLFHEYIFKVHIDQARQL